jgi:hypothetical protein
MKKLFAILIAFALVFASCPTEPDPNSDVIGIWTNTEEKITLDIAKSTWILVTDGGSSTSNGKWTRNANTLTLYSHYEKNYPHDNVTFATARLSEGKLFFVRGGTTYTLTKKGKTAKLPPGTLKINNQSFTEITDVTWNNVSFAETEYVNSIRSGNNVTKNVEAGGGYIFFKRKSNPITARTRDIIILEEGKNNVEFTFTDDTVIIEVNNTTNTGTLRNLQNTVVWFDDAEGEMQPYYLRQHFAGYYSTEADLSLANNKTLFYSPKNGKKSIAIGNSATSLLHLKITLTRKAKLSFWYANRGTASFLINDDEKFSSKQNIAWSFIEFDLEEGVNDLIWKNTTAPTTTTKDTITTTTILYFFLDDILIYYTE